MNRIPVVHYDLSEACRSLAMLIAASGHFVPEEEWRTLADEMRPHLVAATAVMDTYCERFAERIRLQYKEGADEVVMFQLACLRHALRGRVSTGPGDPLRPER